MPSVAGELQYPKWLAGKWRVTNTAVGFTMPLGARYVDPFLVQLAGEEVAASKTRQYSMRFVDDVPPPVAPALSVRQDQAFNSMEEERAFTASRGATIERGLYAVDPAHPHGRIVMDVRDLDPSPGDAPQGAGWEVRKTFRSQLELDVTWAAWEESRGSVGVDGSGGGAFVTSEIAVQRVRLPQERGVVESYLELLTRFERPSASSSTVRAQYRVVEYLSLPGLPDVPTAQSASARRLAKQAADQAVALLDYELIMERVADG